MAAPSGSASASPIIGSSGAVLVMKPANIAAVFFRSSSASSYWSSRNSRTIAGRHMRQPPDLAGVDRPVDVQHVRGRHAHRFRDHRAALIGAVAGMAAAEVIGHAPADGVELDPAADAVAVRRRLRLLERQHLRLQELQLQRDRQPVLGPARAQPHEALAGDEHLARDHGLQAVEVGQPVGIGLVGPGEPEPLDPIPQVRVPDQRRGLDAVADEVRGEGLAGVGGVAVGDHQLARPRQQPRAARGDQRVDVLERRVPAAQASPRHGAFQTRAHGGRAAGRPAAEAIEEPHGSEPLRRRHADLPHDPSPLGRRDLAVERLDGPVDLGHAAIVHGLAVVAHPRDARGPLRGQRLAACRRRSAIDRHGGPCQID